MGSFWVLKDSLMHIFIRAILFRVNSVHEYWWNLRLKVRMERNRHWDRASKNGLVGSQIDGMYQNTLGCANKQHLNLTGLQYQRFVSLSGYMSIMNHKKDSAHCSPEGPGWWRLHLNIGFHNHLTDGKRIWSLTC